MISEKELAALVEMSPAAIKFYLAAILSSGGEGDTGSTFEEMSMDKEECKALFGDAIAERDGRVFVAWRIGRPIKRAASEKALVDLVVNMFNATAPDGVAKVLRNTIKDGGQRHKQIVARFKDMKEFYSLDGKEAALAFGKFFQYCWQSNFLCNKVQKREGQFENFKVTFDWILKPKWFPLICQGDFNKEPFDPR